MPNFIYYMKYPSVILKLVGYENLVRGFFAGEKLVKNFSWRDFFAVGFFRGRFFRDLKFSWLGFLAPIFFRGVIFS